MVNIFLTPIRRMFSVTAYIIALIICLSTLGWILFAIAKTEPFSSIIATSSQDGNYLSLLSPGRETQTPFHISRIGEDHRAISSWLMKCIDASLISNITDYDRDAFNIPTPEFFGILPYTHEQAGFNRVSDTRQLFNNERALLQISKILALERLQLQKTSIQNYEFLQITTWVAILLGLMTTILVAASSTEFGKGDQYFARSIRLLAIVFPALSTASAALVAFYNPREELGRASVTLANLNQLHNQIAIDVWSLRCITPNIVDTSKALNDSVQNWNKRLRDIQAASASTGAEQTAVRPNLPGHNIGTDQTLNGAGR